RELSAGCSFIAPDGGPFSGRKKSRTEAAPRGIPVRQFFRPGRAVLPILSLCDGAHAAQAHGLAEHALAAVHLQAVLAGHHHGAGISVAAMLYSAGPLVLGRLPALHDDLVEVLAVLVVLVAQPDQARAQGTVGAVHDLV